MTDKNTDQTASDTPEVPRSLNWFSIAETDFEKALRYKAHAEKLAEAMADVEAHSHWSNDIEGYVVDKAAMDSLCLELGKWREAQ